MPVSVTQSQTTVNVTQQTIATVSVVAGQRGENGASAYEVAVANGFVGDESTWLASLVGAKGDDGDRGADGIDGTNGADGLSAYQVAVNNGFVGSQSAWLASLTGPKGDDGEPGINGTDGIDGLSAYEIAVANGFVGTQSAWLSSLVGPKGDKGDVGDQGEPGVDGTNGLDGEDGLSAYQVATANGFVGSESAWLASLVGPQGEPGADGVDGTSGPITNNSATLTSDVQLSTNNSFATGPSMTLTAGTWLLLGFAQFQRTTTTASQVTARLRNAGTVVATQNQYHASLAGITLGFSLMAISSVATSATIDLQMATSAGATTALMKASSPNNGSGNVATRIVAIRLGD